MGLLSSIVLVNGVGVSLLRSAYGVLIVDGFIFFGFFVGRRSEATVGSILRLLEVWPDTEEDPAAPLALDISDLLPRSC